MTGRGGDPRDHGETRGFQKGDRNGRPGQEITDSGEVGIAGYNRNPYQDTRSGRFSLGYGKARREGLTTSDDGPGRHPDKRNPYGHSTRGNLGFGDAVEVAALDRILDPMSTMDKIAWGLKQVIPGGSLVSALQFGVDVAQLMGAKPGPVHSRDANGSNDMIVAEEDQGPVNSGGLGGLGGYNTRNWNW